MDVNVQNPEADKDELTKSFQEIFDDTVDIPACSDEANTVIDGTDNSDDNQNMSISDHVASEGYVSGTNEVEAESESSSLEEEKFANEKKQFERLLKESLTGKERWGISRGYYVTRWNRLCILLLL